jgi:hypothetical protein
MKAITLSIICLYFFIPIKASAQDCFADTCLRGVTTVGFLASFEQLTPITGDGEQTNAQFTFRVENALELGLLRNGFSTVPMDEADVAVICQIYAGEYEVTTAWSYRVGLIAGVTRLDTGGETLGVIWDVMGLASGQMTGDEFGSACAAEFELAWQSANSR